jgi:hypothetical protein
MTSQGNHTNRAELLTRLATVMEASRAIRSEVALTISESREMRLASRQLRGDSFRTSAESAMYRQNLQGRKSQRIRGIADAIAEILSRQGYAVFVAGEPQDTASVQ